MSFWNCDNYKVKLVNFVERFIPHGCYVKLYQQTISHSGNDELSIEYKIIWEGPSWKITEPYIDSSIEDFCPYSENNVEAVKTIDLTAVAKNEVQLVIEV